MGTLEAAALRNDSPVSRVKTLLLLPYVLIDPTDQEPPDSFCGVPTVPQLAGEVIQ